VLSRKKLSRSDGPVMAIGRQARARRPSSRAARTSSARSPNWRTAESTRTSPPISGPSSRTGRQPAVSSLPTDAATDDAVPPASVSLPDLPSASSATAPASQCHGRNRGSAARRPQTTDQRPRRSYFERQPPPPRGGSRRFTRNLRDGRPAASPLGAPVLAPATPRIRAICFIRGRAGCRRRTRSAHRSPNSYMSTQSDAPRTRSSATPQFRGFSPARQEVVRPRSPEGARRGKGHWTPPAGQTASHEG